MDTNTAVEYAQILGIGLGAVLAIAVVALVVGAVFRTLSSYSALRARSAAKRAEADADRAKADAQARVAREEADAKIRVAKAKESGMLQQAMAVCDEHAERVRVLERRVTALTAERDDLIARSASSVADRDTEREAIAAAVVAGIVAAVKTELVDLGPGTLTKSETAAPAGFTPDQRAPSWQTKATMK